MKGDKVSPGAWGGLDADLGEVDWRVTPRGLYAVSGGVTRIDATMTAKTMRRVARDLMQAAAAQESLTGL